MSTVLVGRVRKRNKTKKFPCDLHLFQRKAYRFGEALEGLIREAIENSPEIEIIINKLAMLQVFCRERRYKLQPRTYCQAQLNIFYNLLKFTLIASCNDILI